MKKSVLLVLASAALMMAACGGNKPTPSTSSPTDTSEEGTSITTSEGGTSEEGTSEEGTSEDVVYVESIGASASLSLEEGDSVEFPVEISPANAPQGFTVTSTDDEVAYYDNGYVVAGKAGTATLTITSEGVDLTGEHLATTTTVTVEKAVVPLPTVIDTDIDAIQSFSSANENKIYSFSGILEALNHTDKYGNAVITDPVSGKYVTIYGMTTTDTVIAWNEAATALEYKNPKDAVTTLAEVNNGDLVTVHGIYSSSFKNFSVILDSSEAATTTYTASVTNEAGVTLSKAEGLAYGEEVTVNIVVPDGKVVDSVTVNHGYGTETVEAAEGVYKFGAKVVNKVTVTFTDAAAPTGTVSYDIAGNLDKFVDTDGVALGTNYAEASAKISGVTFTGTLISVPSSKAGNWEGNGLAMRAKIKNEEASESAKQYLTIESAHAFTGASIVMQGWTTDRSETTLEYSTDGVNWTKDSCEAVTLDGSAADATTHTLTIADTISVKYVRLASWGKGSGKSYQSRIGIFSATLTYPEA